MGVILGYPDLPLSGGADNYPVGFTGALRVVIPSTGTTNKTITKIGGWVSTQSNPPTVEAFRFAISHADDSNSQNEETNVASRIYLSSSNILLSSVASASGDFEYEETISVPVTAGDVLFIKQITWVAGDIRFIYDDGQTGQRIYDAHYVGISVPPPDPQNPGNIAYYDDYVYGIWIEVEDDVAYTPPPLLLGSLM